MTKEEVKELQILLQSDIYPIPIYDKDAEILLRCLNACITATYEDSWASAEWSDTEDGPEPDGPAIVFTQSYDDDDEEIHGYEWFQKLFE